MFLSFLKITKLLEGVKFSLRIRSDLAYQLVTEYAVALAETGRQMGVPTSAIPKILKGRERVCQYSQQHTLLTLLFFILLDLVQ